MKTVRLGCTDIGAILFAGIDDDNNLCSTYISVGGDGEFTGLLTTNKAEIPPIESVIGSECFDIETTLSEVKYVFDGFVVEVDYENNKLIKLVIHDETQPGKIIKYGEVYTNE